MIAISLKTNSIIILLSIIISNSYAQTLDCNQEVHAKYLKKSIPKGICIPKGLVIQRIYNTEYVIDFNKDGLVDFVFECSKDPKRDGDSTLLYFYTMQKDSSYRLFRIYENLIPIFLNVNQEESEIKSTVLKKAIDCYQTLTPLDYIEIKQDTLILKRYIANSESKKYVFKFDIKYNDWKLVKLKYLIGDNYSKEMFIQPNLLLSEFSYCEY